MIDFQQQEVDEIKPVLLVMPLFFIFGALAFDYFFIFIGATLFFSLCALFCIINTFFNKSLGFALHLLLIILLIVSIVSSKEHLSDLPIYLSKDYEVIEGVVLVTEGRKGNSIYVNSIHFGYNVPEEIDNSYGGKNIKLWYLPNTKIIMDWELAQ